MKKYILQFIYSIVFRNILRLIIGVKFEKSNFLLNEEQFVIIANHNSHLDTIALMSALPHQIVHKVKPVAAHDYFGKTPLLEKCSNFLLNTLLIKRSSNSNMIIENPIKQMIHELDKGYSLIVFPEGTRGNPEVMEPMKKGIALVLKERPLVKFIPVFLFGMGKAMPKGDGIILPYNSFVRFGESEHINSSSSKDEIIAVIEQRLLALKDK